MDGYVDLTDLMTLALRLNKERHKSAQVSSVWVLFFHWGASVGGALGLCFETETSSPQCPSDQC